MPLRVVLAVGVPLAVLLADSVSVAELLRDGVVLAVTLGLGVTLGVMEAATACMLYTSLPVQVITPPNPLTVIPTKIAVTVDEAWVKVRLSRLAV